MSYYFLSLGRFGGRSFQETDRLELLQSAEPVDYTGTETNLEDFTSAAVDFDSELDGRYQNQGSRGSGRYNSTASRGSKTPPRGIFDDV